MGINFKKYQKKYYNLLERVSLKNKKPLSEIDIIIPAIKKDIGCLPTTIHYAKKNILHNIKNFFVIGPEDNVLIDTVQNAGATFVNEESILPFEKTKIHFICGGLDRSGWLIQQFIKLNGNEICSSKKFLVIDADTVLISPQMFEHNNRDILLFSDEFHEPYYQVFEKVFTYKTNDQISCVTHHMLFDTKKLNKMKDEIEHVHNKTWFDAILGMLDYSQASCFSEYELYGHWVCKNFGSDICRRYFYNIAFPKEKLRDITKLEKKYGRTHRSISFHSYL